MPDSSSASLLAAALESATVREPAGWIQSSHSGAMKVPNPGKVNAGPVHQDCAGRQWITLRRMDAKCLFFNPFLHIHP